MDIPRTPTRKRRLRRVALAAVACGALGLAVGAVIQWRRDVDFHSSHPAPGAFATVDGHRLHYRLSGRGEYTFVLEAGLGDYSGSWGELESQLARLGRVFVYDRAGLGWSEAGSTPRDADHLATELQAVLAQAGVGPRRILVGHSLGAVVVLRLAAAHPETTAGLILIDPSHPEQLTRMPPPPFLLTTLAPLLMRAAPVGLPQLLFGSKDPVQNQARHVQATADEFSALLHRPKSVTLAPGSLGRIPLVVLTAGSDAGLPGNDAEQRATWEIWKELHDELAALSTSAYRRHLVIAEATHTSHRTHPEAVAQSARDLLAYLQAANTSHQKVTGETKAVVRDRGLRPPSASIAAFCSRVRHYPVPLCFF